MPWGDAADVGGRNSDSGGIRVSFREPTGIATRSVRNAPNPNPTNAFARYDHEMILPIMPAGATRAPISPHYSQISRDLGNSPDRRRRISWLEFAFASGCYFVYRIRRFGEYEEPSIRPETSTTTVPAAAARQRTVGNAALGIART